jgi:hypothetical protein
MFRHSPLPKIAYVISFEVGEVCNSTQGIFARAQLFFNMSPNVTQPLVSRLSCRAAIGREIDSSHSLYCAVNLDLFSSEKLSDGPNAEVQTGTQ